MILSACLYSLILVILYWGMHRHPTHLDSEALRVKHSATWQVPSEEANRKFWTLLIFIFIDLKVHFYSISRYRPFLEECLQVTIKQRHLFWILCWMTWIICLYLGMSKTCFLSFYRTECLCQPLHGNQGSLLCFSSGSRIPAHVTVHANGSRWQWCNWLCLMRPLAASAATAVVDAKTTLSLELNQDAFWPWRQWKESKI